MLTSGTPRQATEAGSRDQPGRPPVDLIRHSDHIIMIVSLPGLKPSDFRISLVGDRQVYIEGTAHYRHPVPQESLALSERPYGPFQRTMNLPFPVTAQGVDVRLADGVLTVYLPLRRQPLWLHWTPTGGIR